MGLHVWFQLQGDLPDSLPSVVSRYAESNLGGLLVHHVERVPIQPMFGVLRDFGMRWSGPPFIRFFMTSQSRNDPLDHPGVMAVALVPAGRQKVLIDGTGRLCPSEWAETLAWEEPLDIDAGTSLPAVTVAGGSLILKSRIADYLDVAVSPVCVRGAPVNHVRIKSRRLLQYLDSTSAVRSVCPDCQASWQLSTLYTAHGDAEPLQHDGADGLGLLHEAQPYLLPTSLAVRLRQLFRMGEHLTPVWSWNSSSAVAMRQVMRELRLLG